jgi:hypothetical protein
MGRVSFQRVVESSRASPPHRLREDGLAHPTDTSRPNLASVLGVLSRVAAFQTWAPVRSPFHPFYPTSRPAVVVNLPDTARDRSNPLAERRCMPPARSVNPTAPNAGVPHLQRGRAEPGRVRAQRGAGHVPHGVHEPVPHLRAPGGRGAQQEDRLPHGHADGASLRPASCDALLSSTGLAGNRNPEDAHLPTASLVQSLS